MKVGAFKMHEGYSIWESNTPDEEPVTLAHSVHEVFAHKASIGIAALTNKKQNACSFHIHKP